MTRIFTEGNTQTYYNIFYLISASETEAIDQSITITSVVKPEKNNKVRVSVSLNSFTVKQLSSKDWL